MRIGMVCPYSFDVPGGVQSHVLQLAEVMHSRGLDVSVLAPSSPHVQLPDYVVSGGKAVPIPYNGSVARLRFGPATHRMVKRWILQGDFDVLHLHEPNAPSLSMLALNIAEGPIVATFHTSTTKSLTLSVFEPLLRPMHEKIVGRIAVSDLARRWQMEALGSDAALRVGRGGRHGRNSKGGDGSQCHQRFLHGVTFSHRARTADRGSRRGESSIVQLNDQ